MSCGGFSSRAPVTLVVFQASADVETTASAAAALGPHVRLLTVEPPRSYTAGSRVRGLVTRYPSTSGTRSDANCGERSPR